MAFNNWYSSYDGASSWVIEMLKIDILDIKESVIRVAIFGLGIVLSALIVGCVYIPPIGEDDAGVDPASFKVGATLRQEVLDVLGDPMIDDGRFIVDELETSDGGFLLVAQYGAGYIPIGLKRTRLLIEFDDADILQLVEIEASRQVGIHGEVVSDENSLPELQPMGALVPFEDVSWLRGPPTFSAANFSAKGDLLALSDRSGRVFLVNFASGTIKRISPDGFDTDGAVISITFSPGGDFLAVQARTIRILDLKTQKQTILYEGHGNASFWDHKGANAMSFSPSGEMIASVGTNGSGKIWDASSGREIASWLAHNGGAYDVVFSTDGNVLATAGRDGFVRLWNSATGGELGAIIRNGKLAFSDDGKLLAIASSAHAELWRVGRVGSDGYQGQTLAEDKPMDMTILPFELHLRRYPLPLISPSPNFTPDGRRLLLNVGAAVIWDWADSQKTPLSISEAGAFLAFDRAGQAMATWSPDGIRLWKLP